MREPSEFLTAFAEVRPPKSSGVMVGAIQDDGIICARTFSGDFELLIPAALGRERAAVARIGSVSVQAVAEYRVQVNDGATQGHFLRVALASDRADLLRAFVFAVLACLPSSLPIENASGLEVRLEEILRLLQGDSRPTPEAVKGLWAELWFIDESPDPASCLLGWHGQARDKVDFSIGQVLVEVKCHEGRRRVHHLRLDQLQLQPERTYVLSVCIAATPSGRSIGDLVDSIAPHLSTDEFGRLFARVIEVVGSEVDLVSDYRFDIWPDQPPVAVLAALVPRPVVDCPEVSDVSFRVDLTDAAMAAGQSVSTLFADATREDFK